MARDDRIHNCGTEILIAILERVTPPTRQKDFTDFSKFLRIFLKGNVTKIRVSVNQVKIYKFFQDFARILVEKTRTTRIGF